MKENKKLHKKNICADIKTTQTEFLWYMTGICNYVDGCVVYSIEKMSIIIENNMVNGMWDWNG